MRFGNFAGGLATGYLRQEEEFRKQALADREQKDWEDLQAYKAQQQAVGAPAEVETRTGLMLTDPSNPGAKPIYVPQEAARIYTTPKGQTTAEGVQGLGYTQVGAPVAYREVNAGGRNIGQYAGDTAAADAGRALTEYNDNRIARLMANAQAAGRTQDMAAYAAADLHDLNKRRLGQQVESAGYTLDEQKRASEIMKEFGGALTDPAEFLRKQYDRNLGAGGQGDHAGATLQVTKLPDGSAILTPMRDGSPMMTAEGGPMARVLSPTELQGAVREQLLSRLSEISPQYAMHNAERLDKSLHNKALEALEARKLDLTEKRDKAADARMKEHYANELKKIDNERDKWNALYGRQNSMQDFLLGEMRGFAIERKKINEDIDAGVITEAEGDRRLARASRKYGQGGSAPRDTTARDTHNMVRSYNDLVVTPQYSRLSTADQDALLARLGLGDFAKDPRYHSGGGSSGLVVGPGATANAAKPAGGLTFDQEFPPDRRLRPAPPDQPGWVLQGLRAIVPSNAGKRDYDASGRPLK